MGKNISYSFVHSYSEKYRNLISNESVLFQPRGKEMYCSTLWGPALTGKDQIAENIFLPQMKVGDWIIFRDMGAYTFVLGGNFGSFERPETYNVASADVA